MPCRANYLLFLNRTATIELLLIWESWVIIFLECIAADLAFIWITCAEFVHLEKRSEVLISFFRLSETELSNLFWSLYGFL